MSKINKEKFKTMHNVFDEFTNRTIFKLITEKHIDGLQSPIKIGKEANVFSAKSGKKLLIVKIYRVNACNFNKMFDYIKQDPRYIGLQSKRRNIIFHWVQREYRNLINARKAGVKVPIPITFKNHVLVMELIGDNGIVSPMLKDAYPKNHKKFFDEIIKSIKKLYMAGLVHADISGFNILNHNENPVFIDFSQCSSTKDINALDYLKRDIKTIVNFFNKYESNYDYKKIYESIKT
jgi:RIO kinase 1